MIITHHYQCYFYDCNQNAEQMPLSAVADMALSCPLCAWINRRIQVNYLAAGKHSIRSQSESELAACGSPAWPCTMKVRKK